ncbi:glycosyltransferase family 4 protein [Pelagicoccus enzymogenes]|uniref:glycosyltransferase family 4 protein n=1 Tax=Pelagicoccus enzymogenes TaxID=2773457 RepID=UPI00280F0F6F|nr:glycosyltransferase family 4 protein [Pelagicoccus enzymogenes]MDQ8198896.1 glycosyltransferase family 4 protein [Pelagicoccus enzymogenes]
MKNFNTSDFGSCPLDGESAFVSKEGKDILGRLLWIVGGDEGYGFRRAHLGFASDLRSRGIEIGFVIREQGTFADELVAAGYSVFFLSDRNKDRGIRGRGVSYLFGCIESVRDSLVHRKEIASAIRAFEADWVHVSINSGILKAGLAARSAQVPVFWHIHNTINSKLPFGLQSLAYRSICRVLSIKPLANSRHTADSLGGGNGFCGVLYPGTDEKWFSPSAPFEALDKESVGLPQDLPVFLVAARLVKAKAQHLVVEAFLELIEEGVEVALILAGGPLDSDYAKELQDKVDAAGVTHLVRFLGQVEDTRPYLGLADVVINSRLNAEPFGLSVIEAQFMERPVLAYALGGPSETVLDGETGWLIEEPTKDCFKRGIRRALEERDSWGAMGVRARERAVPLYSLGASSDNYLKRVYQARGSLA